MNKVFLSLACVVLLSVLAYVDAQTAEHRGFCSQHNGNCGNCLKAQNDTMETDGRCYFCKKLKNGTKDQCLPLGFSLIREQADCPNLNYNVGICEVTAIVWIVLIVVVILIGTVCCCTFCCLCCCWCHRRRLRQREAEEEHYLQEKDSIRQKSADRRAERKAKNDEIRKKYGLSDDTTGTYKRLD